MEFVERVSMATVVSIVGEDFHLNGQPTYPGRVWQGRRIEGLLMNSRMIQGIFDDLNSQTRGLWDGPDGPFDAERNTDRFIEAMPTWREHGLLCFNVGLQGGSPQGYSQHQPWHNSAFEADGALRPAYMSRLDRILRRADELGMVPLISYFYFGQVHRFENEAAVWRAADEATDWLTSRGDRHVMVEIAIEADIPFYRNTPIESSRVHELILRVQERSRGKLKTPAGRLLVGTSMMGGSLATDEMVKVSDMVLLHGNGVNKPDRIREMVDQTRAQPTYRGQPILFNEDDHYDFDKPDNNMIAALDRRASWGYFDYRMEGEGYEQGYQSMPCDWGISSDRKRGFFGLLREVTGGKS